MRGSLVVVGSPRHRFYCLAGQSSLVGKLLVFLISERETPTHVVAVSALQCM